MVGQNKWVHRVIFPCPWTITPQFIAEHGIHLIAHDDLPYAMGAGGDKGEEEEGSGDIYWPIKKAGRFAATQRTQGVSTTDLVGRILRDYDEYI